MLLALALAGCGGQDGATTGPAAKAITGTSETAPQVMRTLTVQLPTPLAGVQVFSAPEGIACGSVSSPVCQADFPDGAKVTLRAIAPEGLRFEGWAGDCSGLGCALDMTANRVVQALFSPVPAPDLSLAPVCDAYTGPALSSLQDVEGLMHEHSSYSDGDPTATPETYFKLARDRGYAFVGASEHSDSYDNGDYVTLHASCLPDTSPSALTPSALQALAAAGQKCFASPTQDKLIKWDSTLSQAQATTKRGQFLAIRGFEWTSDIFGHINVYFSKNFTNAKTDLGYAVTMETFWSWFTRDPNQPGPGGAATGSVVALSDPQNLASNYGALSVPFGGGGDGLAHFNHPGDKCYLSAYPQKVNDVANPALGQAAGAVAKLPQAGDPVAQQALLIKQQMDNAVGNLCDWNHFKMVPAAEPRMFGLEVYNDSNRGDRFLPYYFQGLDAGWHLSPIGSEDEHFGDYASEDRPKTVTQLTAISEPGFKDAWLARRTYALTSGVHLRAMLLADNAHPMGSRLVCDTRRKTVPLKVRVAGKDGSAREMTYRLFTNQGTQVTAVTGQEASFQLPIDAAGKERYYFVRADLPNGGPSQVYLAPVWIMGK